MEFSEAVKRRRSVRKYDPNQPIDAEIVRQCIEMATLAPNSSNMQLWEFYHLTDKKALKKMSRLCFNQNAAKTAQQIVVMVVRKDLWRKRAEAHVKYLHQIFGEKPKNERSKREKFAFNYYTKLIPLAYFDILGLVGLLKYGLYWIIGLFRPVFRQGTLGDMRIVAHKSAALAAQTFMLAMADKGYDTCPMEGSDTLRIKKMLGLPYGAEINMVVGCGIRLPEGIYGARFRVPFEEVYKKI